MVISPHGHVHGAEPGGLAVEFGMVLFPGISLCKGIPEEVKLRLIQMEDILGLLLGSVHYA